MKQSILFGESAPSIEAIYTLKLYIKTGMNFLVYWRDLKLMFNVLMLLLSSNLVPGSASHGWFGQLCKGQNTKVFDTKGYLVTLIAHITSEKIGKTSLIQSLTVLATNWGPDP